MFQLDRNNVSKSIGEYLKQNSSSIVDLLNEYLYHQDDLRKLLAENDIVNPSVKLPGLIVQAYLVLVELFNKDISEPLQRIKVELIESEETPAIEKKEDSKIVSTLKRQRTEDTIEELQVFDTIATPGTSNDPYEMIETPENPRVNENPEQVHPIPHKERVKFPVQTKIEILEFIDSLPPDPKGKPRSSYELAQLIRSQFQRYIDPTTVRRILRERELIKENEVLGRSRIRLLTKQELAKFPDNVPSKCGFLFS